MSAHHSAIPASEHVDSTLTPPSIGEAHFRRRWEEHPLPEPAKGVFQLHVVPTLSMDIGINNLGCAAVIVILGVARTADIRAKGAAKKSLKIECAEAVKAAVLGRAQKERRRVAECAGGGSVLMHAACGQLSYVASVMVDHMVLDCSTVVDSIKRVRSCIIADEGAPGRPLLAAHELKAKTKSTKATAVVTAAAASRTTKRIARAEERDDGDDGVTDDEEELQIEDADGHPVELATNHAEATLKASSCQKERQLEPELGIDNGESKEVKEPAPTEATTAPIALTAMDISGVTPTLVEMCVKYGLRCVVIEQQVVQKGGGGGPHKRGRQAAFAAQRQQSGSSNFEMFAISHAVVGSLVTALAHRDHELWMPYATLPGASHTGTYKRLLTALSHGSGGVVAAEAIDSIENKKLKAVELVHAFVDVDEDIDQAVVPWRRFLRLGGKQEHVADALIQTIAFFGGDRCVKEAAPLGKASFRSLPPWCLPWERTRQTASVILWPIGAEEPDKAVGAACVHPGDTMFITIDTHRESLKTERRKTGVPERLATQVVVSGVITDPGRRLHFDERFLPPLPLAFSTVASLNGKSRLRKALMRLLRVCDPKTLRMGPAVGGATNETALRRWIERIVWLHDGVRVEW